jgi:hypothetical protein
MQNSIADTTSNSNQPQPVEAALIEQTLAANKPTDEAHAPRARRTIGLTEQRLRERNEPAWYTTSAGWSRFFRRFSSGAGR